MSITEVTILHHVGIVLFLLWFLSSFDCCHPAVYFISLIYLYLVHDRYLMRLRRNVQFEERRHASQRRVLSDSETVRWLNHAVEKIWPVCMEQIVSQKILLPIIPWFMQKYKPWTVKDFLVQHLYMGRSPPMFTEIRVLRQSNNDDHLVLELGMNFRTADDMSAILAVKLRKRLGFGMWAKLHLMGMHIEGKVLVGVKFLPKWPFLSRLRVCFAEPPYFQMTVKPLMAHGLDVTELPGIAGWIDKLLAVAFEETLVEPNMLVVDVEKLTSPQSENWFSIDAKEPIAYALVEVVEAVDMKPSDLNGLADPYVKGQVGSYRFRTKTQRKSLSPKWHEEFKIPICTWESPNLLTIDVHDKDHFVDDFLGDCSVSISDLRDGQRHDMWLPLQNIKMGRLHLAITVLEANEKGTDQLFDVEMLNNENKRDSFASDTAQKGSFSSVSSGKPPRVEDDFEPINIEGQRETGVWVHRPGTEVPQLWEPRKGKSRLHDTQISGEGSFKSSGSYPNDSSSTDESQEGNKTHMARVRRGLQKIGSVFHRSPRNEEKEEKFIGVEDPAPSPHVNLRAVNAKGVGVHFIVEDNLSAPSSIKSPKTEERGSPDVSGSESPSKGHVKDVAKSILKHAGKSARSIKHALSRKGSRKSRDVSVGSESSDDEDESLPSSDHNPLVEADPIVSDLISVGGGESFKSESFKSEASPKNPAVNTVGNIEEVGIEGKQNIGEIVPGSSKEYRDGVSEENSNSKLSGEVLGVDK